MAIAREERVEEEIYLEQDYDDVVEAPAKIACLEVANYIAKIKIYTLQTGKAELLENEVEP